LGKIWLDAISVALLGGICRLVTVAPAHAATLSGKRILFLGDSITQGGEYVTFVEYYLDKLYPTRHFDIISIGLSSETVSGLTENAHPFPRPWLHERLWAALGVVRPDIVFACYGMNDGIYHPQGPERLAAFQSGIRKLIAVDKAAGAGTVLMTPPPFDPTAVPNSVRPITAADFSYLNPYDHYDSVLADYARWEMTLPATDAQVVDLHTPLADYLASRQKADPTFHCSADGIHPNAAGSLLMAQTILQALGIPLQIKDLDREVMTTAADPLFALVVKHRETRSNGWLPYVGYTREESVKSDSIAETEQDASALQAQIDQLRSPP
jgi:lysophospholipase L1-like esterase